MFIVYIAVPIVIAVLISAVIIYICVRRKNNMEKVAVNTQMDLSSRYPQASVATQNNDSYLNPDISHQYRYGDYDGGKYVNPPKSVSRPMVGIA